MVFVGENKELPHGIATDSSNSIVNRHILVLNLFQHNGEHHHIVDSWILQQINLVEDDIGVDDEDSGGGGTQASGGGVAGGAEGGAAVDVVAEVVLPHLLHDLASFGFLNERLVVKHLC